ncbi:hypothetical protein EE612_028484, partial [Oryza sativa]
SPNTQTLDTGAEQEEAYGCSGGEPPSRRLRRWRGRTTRRRRAAGSPRSRSAVGPESVAAWRLTATARTRTCRTGGCSSGFPWSADGSSTHPPATTVARLLPITLGQVFQRIDVVSKDFGNIVDVELGGLWLLLPVEVMATLAHKFGIIGEVGFCVQC